MAYTKYSLTPANNNAAPPDGAPEGMLPSAVNDTMRDMMAQIRDCGDGIRGGTYTMTAPVITGGSINGAAIGASSASTGAFTTLAYSSTLTGGTGVVNLGSGQFYKDASGNIGVGSSAPTVYAANDKVLQIYSGANAGAIRISNATTGTNGGWLGYQLGLNSYLSNTSAGALVFATSNAESMRIDSSGNVGIGSNTVAGGYKLQVNGNILLGSTANPFIAGTTTLRLYGDNSASYGMTIDSAGNVGLGASPSGWGSAYKSINISTQSNFYGSSNQGGLSLNAYNDNSNWRYVTTDYASRYAQYQGAHYWQTAPSGTAGNVATFTDRMSVDATSLNLVGLQGIKFQATQSASSDANTLDDYEEGTFTPTVTGGLVYAQQLGKYTKIGNVVHFILVVSATRTASSSQFVFSGLPFASANITNAYTSTVIFPVQGFNKTGATAYATQMIPNANFINIYGYQTNSSLNYLIMTMNDTGATVEAEIAGSFLTS